MLDVTGARSTPSALHRQPDLLTGQLFTVELARCSDVARLLPGSMLEKACELLHYALVRIEVAHSLVDSIPEVQSGAHLATFLRAHSGALGDDAEAVLPQLQYWRVQAEALLQQPETKVQDRVAAIRERYSLAPATTDWGEFAIRLSLALPTLPPALHSQLRGAQDANQGSHADRG